MFSRRNSLRNSQRRNSGMNPAAAAAVVSFNQQNPRQNHAALAAGAAAEALRRHSLDAQGAQMVANFRRNSLSSQTGCTNSMTSQTGRTNSMTRRNSLRTSSTVNRDQYGRAMSLTTTTVRQMGSFEIVKQEESAVRRPRQPHYNAESLYSLESLAEEPEYHDHRPETRYEPHRSTSHRSRVSFLDNTSEFHYDSYNTSESSALAAAAAAAPQHYLKPPGPAPISHKPRSPMKSALKKSSVHSPINYGEIDEPQTIYEDEEYEDNDFREDTDRNRPISAVSQFSTVTAKSHFSDDDHDQASLASPVSSREAPINENTNEDNSEVEEDTLTHEHYSESEDDSVYLEGAAATIPQTPTQFSEAPSLATANVSPLKRNEEGQEVSQTGNVPKQGGHVPNGAGTHKQTRVRMQPPQSSDGANGRQRTQMPRQTAPNDRGGFRSQPNGRLPPRQDQYTQPRGFVQQHPPQQQQQHHQAQRSQPPRQYAYTQPQQGNMVRSNSLRSDSYRPTRLSLPQNVGQQNGRRLSQSPQNRQSFIQAPRRQLQPSPSIESFNRIGNTNDILQKARNRARVLVSEQHSTLPAPGGLNQNIEDDASSVNSDSSWKRSTPVIRSNFGTNMDLSPPGRKPPSVSSSQYGAGRNRISSPSTGRTYSLRGAAPPSISRNFKSRFDDSDDEDSAAYAPTALPQLTSRDDGANGGKSPKKKGFFKRLFSSKH